MSTTHLRVKFARGISRLLPVISLAILATSVLFLPVFTSAVPAAQISLEWDANGEPDLAGYRVYYGTSSGSYTASVDIGNNTHCVISNLEQGVTYYFAATAYDSEGNESGFSDEIVYAVPAAVSPGPGSSSSDGGGSGGGCFIATAAYGSYLAPEVMVLRQFRDHVLLTNVPGKAFVRFYYRVSPPVADFIRDRENLRSLTRRALTPLVYGVKYPKASGAILLVSLAVALMTCVGRKKGEENLRNDDRSFEKSCTVSDLRPKGD